MSVSLLLGLVYLISEKNLIRKAGTEGQRGSELTIDTPNASKSLSFRNQNLEDSLDLPDPDVIAQEIETRSLPTLTHCYPRSFTFYVAHPIHSIVEDLQAALAQFAAVTRVKERPGFQIATDLKR